MVKRISKWLKWAVSAAFLAVVFTAVDLDELRVQAKNINWYWFTASFLLMPAMLFFSCWKWSVAVNHLGFRVGFIRLLNFYMVGYFFTNILPSTVGGDVVRSYYLGRDIKDQGHAAVSVFIERFSGLMFLLLLGFTAPLLAPALYRHIGVAIPALFSLVALAGLVWIWFIPDPLAGPDRLARRLLGLVKWGRQRDGKPGRMLNLYNRIFSAVSSFHTKLAGGIRGLGRSPAVSWKILLLTLVFYFFTWLNVYLAFRTFGQEPAFFQVAAVVPTIMLTFLLPVSQGNIGLAEGAYVFYFGLVGIDAPAALAMALFLRLKFFFIGAVGYFFYLYLGGRKSAPVKAGAAADAP